MNVWASNNAEVHHHRPKCQTNQCPAKQPPTKCPTFNQSQQWEEGRPPVGVQVKRQARVGEEGQGGGVKAQGINLVGGKPRRSPQSTKPCKTLNQPKTSRSLCHCHKSPPAGQNTQSSNGCREGVQTAPKSKQSPHQSPPPPPSPPLGMSNGGRG